MVSDILENKLEELGISIEDFERVIELGQDNQSYHKQLVKFLAALDDFDHFKALMVGRNMELQAQAVANTRTQTDGDGNSAAEFEPFSNSRDAWAAEEDELKEAIRLSIEDEKLRLRLLEQERSDLEEAIRLSMLDAEEAAMLREALREFDEQIKNTKALITNQCEAAGIEVPAEAYPSPKRGDRAQASAPGAASPTPAPTDSSAVSSVSPVTSPERNLLSSLPPIFKAPPPKVSLRSAPVEDRCEGVIVDIEAVKERASAVIKRKALDETTAKERLAKVEEAKRLLVEKSKQERDAKLEEFRQQLKEEEKQPEPVATKSSALTRLLLRKSA